MCHKCGEPIAFKQLPNGRFCPTNVDGSDHFDLCRQLQFEAVKIKGKPKTRKELLNGGRIKVTTGYEHAGRFIATEAHYEDSEGNVI